METQKNFDIQRYLGHWYEVAKKPFYFERGCDYSEAHYTWDPITQTMGIVNTCLNGNREPIRQSKGQARVVNNSDKSKLKIKFFGPDAWPGEGDYYVLYTDYNQYSIVGDPRHQFLWILSRTKQIPKKDLNMLVEKIKSFGYNPDKVLSSNKFLY